MIIKITIDDETVDRIAGKLRVRELNNAGLLLDVPEWGDLDELRRVAYRNEARSLVQLVMTDPGISEAILKIGRPEITFDMADEARKAFWRHNSHQAKDGSSYPRECACGCIFDSPIQLERHVMYMCLDAALNGGKE